MTGKKTPINWFSRFSAINSKHVLEITAFNASLCKVWKKKKLPSATGGWKPLSYRDGIRWLRWWTPIPKTTTRPKDVFNCWWMVGMICTELCISLIGLCNSYNQKHAVLSLESHATVDSQGMVVQSTLLRKFWGIWALQYTEHRCLCL